MLLWLGLVAYLYNLGILRGWRQKDQKVELGTDNLVTQQDPVPYRQT